MGQIPFGEAFAQFGDMSVVTLKVRAVFGLNLDKHPLDLFNCFPIDSFLRCQNYLMMAEQILSLSKRPKKLHINDAFERGDFAIVNTIRGVKLFDPRIRVYEYPFNSLPDKYGYDMVMWLPPRLSAPWFTSVFAQVKSSQRNIDDYIAGLRIRLDTDDRGVKQWLLRNRLIIFHGYRGLSSIAATFATNLRQIHEYYLQFTVNNGHLPLTLQRCKK